MRTTTTQIVVRAGGIRTNRGTGRPVRSHARGRVVLVYFVIGHPWDIYGQMAVYLRLNGVVPPASRRGV